MKEFTRDPIQDENIDNLQCMWYESECCYAWLKTGKYIKAFNVYLHMIGHFHQFIEDQVMLELFKFINL